MSKSSNGSKLETKGGAVPVKLGRSPITGHLVYAPASKQGALSLDKARQALARVRAAREG